jgi:hypothetical protein
MKQHQESVALVRRAVEIESPPLQPAPKYPWTKICALRTHTFVEHEPAKSVAPVRVFACRSCGRWFKFDPDAHKTWAVADDEHLSALQESVSRRWVAQRCAGRRMEADLRDTKRLSRRSTRRAS